MAQYNLANLALDGGDPRQGEKNPAQFALDHGNQADLDVKHGTTTFSIEAAQIHNDPEVLFEEYYHYAQITRAAEHHYEKNLITRKEPFSLGGVLKNRFSKGEKYQSPDGDAAGPVVVRQHDDFSTVTEEEWRTASRATRTATWVSLVASPLPRRRNVDNLREPSSS